MSTCMRNREWEPDPGEVDCIADCGLPLVDRNVKLSYSSTLEGSVLTLICICGNEKYLNETTLSVTCDSNGSWIPNPADFIQSCSPFSTTASLITEIANGSSTAVRVTVLGSVLGVSIFVSVAMIIAFFCLLKKGSLDLNPKGVNRPSHRSKAMPEENTCNNDIGSLHPQTPIPLYEELQSKSTPEHQDLVELKENVAYGPIAKHSVVHN